MSKRNRIRMAGIWRAASGARAPLPGFLIIGAEKAGTSSLYRSVAQHPRIAAAYRKEVRFFTTYFNY